MLVFHERIPEVLYLLYGGHYTNLQIVVVEIQMQFYKSIFLSACMGIMQVEIKRAEPKQPLQANAGMDLGQEEMMVVATMLVVMECMEHTLREQLMEAWVAEEAM
jgi:hypothetical protein